ncbi:hypothetical protein Lal_00019813 [Lupinus albus]|uniref:Epidermal patterning factor-like protein n=1 Tax=Lupinus albus TaxID=3870 RepID=A0A6A5PQL4_LUPAL|nr:hypothetical protein Lalb_Chr01g0007131 [Lupinus albus]KAF1899683.1 hypothetical protein Lal_00019813 [Lupinus albus]
MSTLSLRIHKIFLVVIFLMVLCIGWSLGVTHNHVKLMKLQEEKVTIKEEEEEDMGVKLYPGGSNLPDCSHACGSCFPCKRVIVSYKCLIAESCPVVYKCMCKGKYYHVPAN